MPHKISWYLEPRVMMIQYSGKVSLLEIQQVYEESRGMMVDCTERVYTLLDMTSMLTMPMDIRGFRNLFSVKLLPIQGAALMYGHHPIFDIIHKAVIRLTPIPIYCVANLEEALVWLRTHDAALGWWLDPHGDDNH